MAVSYPLSLPTSVGIVNSRFGLRRVAGEAESPFTLTSQVTKHAGERWEGEITFAPSTRAQAADIQAFITRMRGKYGTFLYGDPDNLALGNRGTPALTTGTTNYIRNGSAVGATVGVVGAGGALPTNWAVDTAGGLTTEVISASSFGATIKISGTTTGVVYRIRFEALNNIAALAGQAWTGSFYHRLAGGALTNITSCNVRVTEQNSGGTIVQNSQSAFTPTSTQARSSHTRALTDATTAYTDCMLALAFSVGVAVNVTLEIGLIQHEQQSAETPWIETASVARTRPSGMTVTSGGQTGNQLYVWGLTNNTQNHLRVGDYIQLGSGASSRLHMVTEDFNTGVDGGGYLNIEPALRSSPAAGDAVTYSSPKGLFRLAENAIGWESNFSSIYSFTITFKEAL